MVWKTVDARVDVEDRRIAVLRIVGSRTDRTAAYWKDLAVG